MKRYVEGTDRGQATLFPECLKDWIGENNPVQVIDFFERASRTEQQMTDEERFSLRSEIL
jgi:hypothetical protein